MINNQSVLDDDRIVRLLLKLSLPAFFGMAVITLYNVVDTIFVGHYVGPLGIAGLSIVFPVQMLAMGFSMMTGIGGASLISRLIGAGNIPRAERAAGNAMTATLVIAVIITIAGLSKVDFWLRLIGASETILPYARDYMTVILFGMLFQTFAMVLNSLIRAEGNARVPMTGMIIGALLNIVFCAIFVALLGMGVKGSALAAVVGQLVSVLYLGRYYFSGKNFLKIHLKNLALDWNILKEILGIGVASLATMIAESLSIIFINRALAAYGGDISVSTFGILNRILMFAIMPGIVIGQGLQPILGFNYGAKRYKTALRAIKIAMTVATTCCVVVFVFLYFLPEPFIRIFTSDGQLITAGSYAAKRLFLALYLIGFIMVGSMIFQAIGKVAQSFITAISRSLLFLVPLVFILPRFLKLDGVWLAFPFTDVLTAVLTFILLIPQIKALRENGMLKRETDIEVPVD